MTEFASQHQLYRALFLPRYFSIFEPHSNMDHFITQYFSMNVAHLYDEELAHELYVRDVEVGNEQRSVLDRKCRAELKRESASKLSDIEYRPFGHTMIEELELCDQKVREIKQAIESRPARKVPDQNHKSRLLHYLFRLSRAKALTNDESELNTISEIAGECVKLLNTFYSIASPFPEIRRAEIDIVNDSLQKLRHTVPEDKGAKPKQRPEQPSDSDKQKEAEDEQALREIGDLFSQHEDNDPNDELGAVGGTPTDEVEILKLENTQLKSLVDQLLTRMESMEAQLQNSKTLHHETRNSTTVDKPDESNSERLTSEEPTKNKCSYKDFMDWLVNDQNISPKVPKITKRVSSASDPEIAVVLPDRGNTARDSGSNRLPIHKWKIRYDGSDSGRHLMEFLREIEFNARSEGFTKRELYNAAYHLFGGKARSWFMEVNAQNELGTWDNLVCELKREFLPPDIDYQYERQAHLRKQGARERFQDYYLEMTRIFRNMTVSLDETKKFQILFRNLRSEYKSAMLAANITTIPKMREFGKSFDSINWQWFTRTDRDTGRTQRYERQVNEIGEGKKRPADAEKPWNKGDRFKREFTNSNRPASFKNHQQNQNSKPNPPSAANKTADQKQEPHVSKPDYQKPGPSRNLNTMEKILKSYVPMKKGTCFNCHHFGHNFSQCQQEKQIFCEICGFPGFSLKECPYCLSKNTDKTAQ